MTASSLKFSKTTSGADFNKTLRNRVSEYFAANNKSKYANSAMVWKTVFMISLYFIPYGFMISGLITDTWAIFTLWIIMGVGIAGIGLSVTHDAIHGSYSQNKRVNFLLGYLLNVIGGNVTNWQIQHNVLHHRFTNIEGSDEDISPVKILRFSPHQERKKIHRFQHIYVWFFYGLITLSWVISKDFSRMINYEKRGMLKEQNKDFQKSLTEIIINKLLYYIYILVIPMIVLPIPWWQTLSFFFFLYFALYQAASAISADAYNIHGNLPGACVAGNSTTLPTKPSNIRQSCIQLLH